MKVRMLHSVAGIRPCGRHGFPEGFALQPGEVYDLADSQAEALLANGRAVSAEEPDPPVTAVFPEMATHQQPRRSRKK